MRIWICSRTYQVGAAKIRLRLVAGTCNEEEVVVRLSAKRLELAGETLNKIDSLVRKSLPLDRHNAFVQRAEIGKSDERPFCSCPHIDQNRVLVSLETGPSCISGHIFDFDGIVQTLNPEPRTIRSGSAPRAQMVNKVSMQ